jgi:hypothetical protein
VRGSEPPRRAFGELPTRGPELEDIPEDGLDLEANPLLDRPERLPRCQHENPQGARFCEECAAALARTCSNCGTPLSATAKFCHACAHPVAAGESTPAHFASPEAYTPKHLAEKILTSKSTLEGERKQVTVLFVDVSGFTSLSERLDPEEVHRFMTRTFELMLA